MALDLTIADLAHGNRLHGRDNLRLAIAQRDNGRGCDNGCADDMLASNLVGALTAGQGEDLNRGALLGPPTIVQVVKVAGLALVENRRATEGQGAIAALGEASSVDGAGLRRNVKLELVVGSNVAGPVLGILDDAV